MRTGIEPGSPVYGFQPQPENNKHDEFLLPSSPPPAHAKPASSVSSYSQSSAPPSFFFTQQPSQMMSPDAMLRAYAERQGAPPSSFTTPATGSPKPKGRKLSLRASIGAKLGRGDKEKEKKVIGYPMPITRAESTRGLHGYGAEYAIGEDEDIDGAYVGMAN